MKALKVLIGFLILCAVADASTHRTVYRNVDYGITLPVPSAVQMCPVSSSDRTHHGATFLLGTKDISQCKSSSAKRWVAVWAQFNASEDTKTLHSFLQWQCQYEAKGQCLAPPEGLQLNGLPSEAARVNLPDGSIEILIVTQAGRPDSTFDSTVPANNYELSLHTNASSFDQDMAIFREILGSIKIAPNTQK
ncbi:MAG: hypothetical protein WBE38_17455 [Terracidiphilus sp.]